jgi:aryl-alcohol dehydrogenase-like predicted oxidoreductase
MIPRTVFGRSGHASSRVNFGSYALSNSSQVEANRVLEILLAHGVNHIDTGYARNEGLPFKRSRRFSSGRSQNTQPPFK